MCLSISRLVVLYLVKFSVLIEVQMPTYSLYNNEVISVWSEICFAPNDRESDLY
jgi:hypothetical protein